MVTGFEEIRRIDSEIQNLDDTLSLIHNAIAENIAKGTRNVDEVHRTFEPRIPHLAGIIEKKGQKHHHLPISTKI